MIQWNKVTWYSQLTAVALGVAIFYAGFNIGERTAIPVIMDVPTQATATAEAILPTETELITFKGLEMIEKALPPLPTQEEWDEMLRGSSIFVSRYKEDVVKYGDISKRYNGDDVDTGSYLYVEVADVTGDGVPEQIVSLSGGGSYGTDTYEIVQDDKVIAILNPNSAGRGGLLEPNETGNGFTVTWYRDDMYPGGYCCPVAQMVTRFVYQDSEFRPVSETVELHR